jgi:hypothetical protein
MSRTVWITAVLMLLTGFSCEKLEISGDVPECVRRMAKSLSREEVRNPPAMIVEWTVASGEKYYYVPPYCCDMYSALYDSECNLICAPDGGFTGGGDGRCPSEILGNIESTRIIWEDERERK